MRFPFRVIHNKPPSANLFPCGINFPVRSQRQWTPWRFCFRNGRMHGGEDKYDGGDSEDAFHFKLILLRDDKHCPGLYRETNVGLAMLFDHQLTCPGPDGSYSRGFCTPL